MIDRVGRAVFKRLNKQRLLHGENEALRQRQDPRHPRVFQEPNDALANQLSSEELEEIPRLESLTIIGAHSIG